MATIKLHSELTVNTESNGVMNLRVYFNRDSERYTIQFNVASWNNNTWLKFDGSAKNLQTLLDKFNKAYRAK
jgi:hypothetical protein